MLFDILTGEAQASFRSGDLAVAVALTFYLCGLCFVRERVNLSGPRRLLLRAVSGLMLLACLLPIALETMAVLMAATAALRGRRA